MLQLEQTEQRIVQMKKLLFLVIIYFAFIALGLPDTGFGVAWNEMHLELGMPLDAAGGITMSITLCSAVSGFASGYLLQRFGTGKVTAVSCLATAIAILGYVVSDSYWSLLLLSIPLGFGAGAVDSGLNAYVAEHLSSRHMNWLHCSWGVGATFSPIIITWGMTTFGSWRYGYGAIGVIVLLLSFLMLASLPMWRGKTETKHETNVKAERPVVKGIAPLLSILSYVIYVAVEGGLGLWLSALLIEGRGVDLTVAGTMVGVYFGSLTVGRFLLGFVADRLGNRKLISIGLSISFIGSLLFLIPTNVFIFSIGIVFIGFGFAPIYPCLMHETSNRYESAQAKKIIGQQVAFSYISFLVLVPLMGIVATRIHLEIIPWMVIGYIAVLSLVVKQLNRLT